jgi:hypothetical protein
MLVPAKEDGDFRHRPIVWEGAGFRCAVRMLKLRYKRGCWSGYRVRRVVLTGTRQFQRR